MEEYVACITTGQVGTKKKTKKLLIIRNPARTLIEDKRRHE